MKSDNVKVVNSLRAARKLLSRKGKWTQGALARDEKGKEVKPLSKNATCWCLLGAIEHVAGKNFNNLNKCCKALSLRTGILIPEEWNDQRRRRQDQVLKLLDDTANRLEKEVT